MEKNVYTVFLSLDINSPQAAMFKRFCGEYPVPQAQQKLLFLQCSAAVSEGAYLRVTVSPGPNQGQEWTGRIPHQYVLLITDGPLTEKKLGFV
jgi:hypothetical protein